MAAEAHYRITSPLYSVLMMLMALTALLGGDFNRLGYARRIAAMAALALLARLAGFTIQAAAVESTALNLFQYLLPLGGSGLCLWVLLRNPRPPGPEAEHSA